MTVDCRIRLETVRIIVSAHIDIPGKDYSDRKMSWLRKKLEETLVDAVTNTLPSLKWED